MLSHFHNFVIKFDALSPDVKLNINRIERQNNLIGLIFTIITILFNIIHDFFHKVNPTIKQNEVRNESDSIINADFTRLILLFLKQDLQTGLYLPISNEEIIVKEVSHYDETNEVFIPIGTIDYCEKELITNEILNASEENKYITDTDKKFIKDYGLCLNITNFEMINTDSILNTFRFSKDIDVENVTFSLNVFYKSKIFNRNNYSNPFEYLWEKKKNFFKTYGFYYHELYLQSYKYDLNYASFIFESLRGDQEFFNYEKLLIVESYSNQLQTEFYLGFRGNAFTSNIEVRYITLDDVISSLGGSFSVLFFFAEFLYSNIFDFITKVDTVNSLFRFSKFKPYSNDFYSNTDNLIIKNQEYDNFSPFHKTNFNSNTNLNLKEKTENPGEFVINNKKILSNSFAKSNNINNISYNTLQIANSNLQAPVSNVIFNCDPEKLSKKNSKDSDSNSIGDQIDKMEPNKVLSKESFNSESKIIKENKIEIIKFKNNNLIDQNNKIHIYNENHIMNNKSELTLENNTKILMDRIANISKNSFRISYLDGFILQYLGCFSNNEHDLKKRFLINSIDAIEHNLDVNTILKNNIRNSFLKTSLFTLFSSNIEIESSLDKLFSFNKIYHNPEELLNDYNNDVTSNISMIEDFDIKNLLEFEVQIQSNIKNELIKNIETNIGSNSEEEFNSIKSLVSDLNRLKKIGITTLFKKMS